MICNGKLKDILKADEIAGVDALLGKLNELLAAANHLSPREKKAIHDGHRTLSRLFYGSISPREILNDPDSSLRERIEAWKVLNPQEREEGTPPDNAMVIRPK